MALPGSPVVSFDMPCPLTPAIRWKSRQSNFFRFGFWVVETIANCILVTLRGSIASGNSVLLTAYQILCLRFNPVITFGLARLDKGGWLSLTLSGLATTFAIAHPTRQPELSPAHQQNLTCCAPCGAVAPRVLGVARRRSWLAHKRDACFCAPPRAAPPTF